MKKFILWFWILNLISSAILVIYHQINGNDMRELINLVWMFLSYVVLKDMKKCA